MGELVMKGYRKTPLHLVQTNEHMHSETNDMVDCREQCISSDWAGERLKGHQHNEGREQKMKRQMQSSRRSDQQRRMSRVEELRELVRTGRYQVDSMTLAQSMLDNETHFIPSSQQ